MYSDVHSAVCIALSSLKDFWRGRIQYNQMQCSRSFIHILTFARMSARLSSIFKDLHSGTYSRESGDLLTTFAGDLFCIAGSEVMPTCCQGGACCRSGCTEVRVSQHWAVCETGWLWEAEGCGSGLQHCYQGQLCAPLHDSSKAICTCLTLPRTVVLSLPWNVTLAIISYHRKPGLVSPSSGP